MFVAEGPSDTPCHGQLLRLERRLRGNHIQPGPTLRVSNAQGRLLLLHVLIVAVLAEGGEMGAAQFDRLREALKTAPADLAAMYRRATCARVACLGAGQLDSLRICLAALGTVSPVTHLCIMLLKRTSKL